MCGQEEAKLRPVFQMWSLWVGFFLLGFHQEAHLQNSILFPQPLPSITLKQWAACKWKTWISSLTALKSFAPWDFILASQGISNQINNCGMRRLPVVEYMNIKNLKIFTKSYDIFTKGYSNIKIEVLSLQASDASWLSILTRLIHFVRFFLQKILEFQSEDEHI